VNGWDVHRGGRGPHVRSRGAPCPAGRFGICRTARRSGLINAVQRTDCGAHRTSDMGLREWAERMSFSSPPVAPGWWGVLGVGRCGRGRVLAGLTRE
jgi:hypothetical protein